MFSTPSAITTVSYTHLDVYKRQTPGCLAIYINAVAIAALIVDKHLSALISQLIVAVPVLPPLTVRKVPLPVGSVFHKPLTLSGGKDIALHNPCADTADRNSLKILVMPHYMDKAYL